jgi:hypothetical protein
MREAKSIHDLVVTVLGEIGVRFPDSVIETLLVQDGSFVGHAFRYDGGHAIWWLGTPAIEFYDEDGNLLKVASVASRTGEAA